MIGNGIGEFIVVSVVSFLLYCFHLGFCGKMNGCS